MIGYFGNVKFVSNSKKILTFSDMKYDSTVRNEKHGVIGRKPIKEYIGPELDTVSFTILLSAANGVKPRTELEVWHRMKHRQEARLLVIGGKILGTDKWTVESVSSSWDIIWNKGELYSCKVDITLEEYIEVF
ncbi:phage tail protein [Psychrobacillus sp. FSL K6-2365]|uniref:phage tail protein n=1 Tax=Psychrobacillus sp. FSL K6-2365 TaxID=2921546 RepID=UPI0030F87339